MTGYSTNISGRKRAFLRIFEIRATDRQTHNGLKMYEIHRLKPILHEMRKERASVNASEASSAEQANE